MQLNEILSIAIPSGSVLLTLGVVGAVSVLVGAILQSYLFSHKFRKPYHGLHVLVTGGSSGIGLATAELYVKKGCNVTIVARDTAKLERARTSLAALGGTGWVKALSLDMSSGETVVQRLTSYQEEVSGVDILIACAGNAEPRRLEVQTMGEIEQLFRVNIVGVIACVQAVLPYMRRRRSGRICLVSSGAGLMGFFGYTSYSASKFAVRGFAEALRYEVLRDNIVVSVCYPPDTETPQLESENLVKAEETKLLGGGGLMKPVQVAQSMVNGIHAGNFAILPNFDMFLLGLVTAGFSVPNSFADLLVQVVGSGILRLVVVFAYVLPWERAIRKMKSSSK